VQKEDGVCIHTRVLVHTHTNDWVCIYHYLCSMGVLFSICEHEGQIRMRFRNLLEYNLPMPLLIKFGQQQQYRPKYSITPLTWINCDGEPSEYAENPDNWVLILK